MSRFRRSGPIAVLAAALTLFAAAPAMPQVDTSSCGGNDGNLCTQTTSCVGVLFARICTTVYTYWPAGEGDKEITPR